tara:strand:- start:55 stop:312 length:258 start_codon:yes stop_codon:yes gene_type:complete
MFNFKAKFFPKITSTPTKLWDIYQISRATGKDPLTIKRYMQWAEVKADVLKPIPGRNNHPQQHFSEESFLKFMKWMASGVRGPRI